MRCPEILATLICTSALPLYPCAGRVPSFRSSTSAADAHPLLALATARAQAGRGKCRASSSPRPVSGLAIDRVGSGATGPHLSSLIRGAVSRAPPAFLPSPGSAGSPQRLASVRAWTSRAHHPAAYRCRDRSSAVPATFIRFMTPCSRAGDAEHCAGGFWGVDEIFLARRFISPLAGRKRFQQLSRVLHEG